MLFAFNVPVCATEQVCELLVWHHCWILVLLFQGAPAACFSDKSWKVNQQSHKWKTYLLSPGPMQSEFVCTEACWEVNLLSRLSK